MNDSFLYQAYGVKGYTYKKLAYKDNSIILHLRHKGVKSCQCPNCHGKDIIHYGKKYRQIRSLPVGSKPMFFEIDIPRYQCKECKQVWQASVPFTHGNVSYSFRLSRYVIELLRLGLPIQDVANHLCMSWGTVKEIHKRYLQQRYANLLHIWFSALSHPVLPPNSLNHNRLCQPNTILSLDTFGFCPHRTAQEFPSSFRKAHNTLTVIFSVR